MGPEKKKKRPQWGGGPGFKRGKPETQGQTTVLTPTPGKGPKGWKLKKRGEKKKKMFAREQGFKKKKNPVGGPKTQFKFWDPIFNLKTQPGKVCGDAGENKAQPGARGVRKRRPQKWTNGKIGGVGKTVKTKRQERSDFPPHP